MFPEAFFFKKSRGLLTTLIHVFPIVEDKHTLCFVGEFRQEVRSLQSLHDLSGYSLVVKMQAKVSPLGGKETNTPVRVW